MKKNVPRAWLFDVDGVITDISTHKAARDVLIAILAIISKSEPVAIITGRSIDWLKREILYPLTNLAQDKSILDKLFGSSEFGGVHLRYKGGIEIVKQEEGLSPPPEIKEEAERMLYDFDRSMLMEPKQTLITLACKINHPLEEFQEDQKAFGERLRKLIEKSGLQKEYEVHSDLLGLNIRNRKANKLFAVRGVVEWLTERNIVPEHFVTVGDSQSDTEMAEELQKEYSVEFVFVGDPSKLDKSRLHCPVIFTTAKYAAGTLEYLNNYLRLA